MALTPDEVRKMVSEGGASYARPVSEWWREEIFRPATPRQSWQLYLETFKDRWAVNNGKADVENHIDEVEAAARVIYEESFPEGSRDARQVIRAARRQAGLATEGMRLHGLKDISAGDTSNLPESRLFYAVRAVVDEPIPDEAFYRNLRTEYYMTVASHRFRDEYMKELGWWVTDRVGERRDAADAGYDYAQTLVDEIGRQGYTVDQLGGAVMLYKESEAAGKDMGKSPVSLSKPQTWLIALDKLPLTLGFAIGILAVTMLPAVVPGAVALGIAAVPFAGKVGGILAPDLNTDNIVRRSTRDVPDIVSGLARIARTESIASLQNLVDSAAIEEPAQELDRTVQENAAPSLETVPAEVGPSSLAQPEQEQQQKDALAVSTAPRSMPFDRLQDRSELRTEDDVILRDKRPVRTQQAVPVKDLMVRFKLITPEQKQQIEKSQESYRARTGQRAPLSGWYAVEQYNYVTPETMQAALITQSAVSLEHRAAKIYRPVKDLSVPKKEQAIAIAEDILRMLQFGSEVPESEQELTPDQTRLEEDVNEVQVLNNMGNMLDDSVAILMIEDPEAMRRPEIQNAYLALGKLAYINHQRAAELFEEQGNAEAVAALEKDRARMPKAWSQISRSEESYISDVVDGVHYAASEALQHTRGRSHEGQVDKWLDQQLRYVQGGKTLQQKLRSSASAHKHKMEQRGDMQDTQEVQEEIEEILHDQEAMQRMMEELRQVRGPGQVETSHASAPDLVTKLLGDRAPEPGQEIRLR